MKWTERKKEREREKRIFPNDDDDDDWKLSGKEWRRKKNLIRFIGNFSSFDFYLE